MLLVGDIHLNPKYKDKILSVLEKNILESEENNIIFLGDYVYHFIYDRKSLVDLFNMFLNLAVNYNKKIFVISGNHDWINDVFVFEEGKRIIDAIKGFDKINFITKPKVYEIEDEKILFLPYNLNLDWKKLFKEFDLIYDINDEFDSLVNSSNRNERFSGYLNRFLDQFLLKYGDNFTIVHHYYTTDFTFVGQRGSFKFKDVALFGKKFLANSNIKLISGHLHQSFVYKNYFCCGSIWATSPLESGQFKFIFKYNRGKIVPNLIDINFYLPFEYRDGLITEEVLKRTINELFLDIKSFFNSSFFDIDWSEVNLNIDFSNIILQIIGDDIDYDEMKMKISSDLLKNLKEIKIKRRSKLSNKIVKLMLDEKEKLTTSFKGWKELLKVYLIEKYGKDSEKYLDELRKLKIL